MNAIIKSLTLLIFTSLLLTGTALAGDDMKGHDMKGHDTSSSGKFGDLFHESTVNGYMLSYYLMDLRKQKDADQNMDKPHHIMVYIMDKAHKAVTKGKVGFLVKDGRGNSQKAMAMYMSEGFGITADMKEKGTYTIKVKALVGKDKLLDSFEYEMK